MTACPILIDGACAAALGVNPYRTRLITRSSLPCRLVRAGSAIVKAFTAWRVEVGMWDVGACRRTWEASAAAAVAGAVGRMGCRIGLVASAALVAPAGFGLLAAVDRS